MIARLQRPTLVIAHNKTLAAQLCNEFREFFPENAVEYFVSYYDYYQPEAYLPRLGHVHREGLVDQRRHRPAAARRDVGALARRDVIIVASVSCIYGLGSPAEYQEQLVRLRVGEEHRRETILRRLVDIQYVRNDMLLDRARFRAAATSSRCSRRTARPPIACRCSATRSSRSRTSTR